MNDNDIIIEKAVRMVYTELAKRGIDPMKIDTSGLITQAIAQLSKME